MNASLVCLRRTCDLDRYRNAEHVYRDNAWFCSVVLAYVAQIEEAIHEISVQSSRRQTLCRAHLVFRSREYGSHSDRGQFQPAEAARSGRGPVANTCQIQRAAAAPLSSGRVLKAMAARGAARWMALTTASKTPSPRGGRRTPAPITTQSYTLSARQRSIVRTAVSSGLMKQFSACQPRPAKSASASLTPAWIFSAFIPGGSAGSE